MEGGEGWGEGVEVRVRVRVRFYCSNKQLLDEAEHDMKNYAERGECCRPRLNAEVNKFTRFYYHSCKDQDHLFLHSFFSIFSNAMIDCKLPVRPKRWQRVIVR